MKRSFILLLLFLPVKKLPAQNNLTDCINYTFNHMDSLAGVGKNAFEEWKKCVLDKPIPEFTAICPFSDFPDFAIIRLKYMPNEHCIELKSLKLYINSFREIKVFHEHVINIILEDFVKACDPLRVEIEGDFHVRGNIKTVVHASFTKE